jgi:hypothetical protein
MSRNPLLIVPIRDRRQHRRILTIKNCAVTMLSVAVVFASISIYSEARRGKAGDYGRLFGSQVGTPTRDVSRNVEVVHEGGSVDDQSAPDPMLVAPAGREQLLMAKSNADQPPVSTSEIPPAPIVVVPASAKAHQTTIAGDSKGIVVAKPPASSTAAHPVLSGGIFKQE